MYYGKFILHMLTIFMDPTVCAWVGGSACVLVACTYPSCSFPGVFGFCWLNFRI